MNGHRIGVAAVVVMLALSGGMTASAVTSPSTADNTVAQTDETPTSLQELNASVTFDDQTTSNTTVTVQNVTLAEGGYVAIHDSSVLDENASIEAESVVGVSDYLEAGTHENVTITLYEDVPGAQDDNTTVNGTETLVAMLHVESSDDAPPTTPANNTTEDNATDTPTTPVDNATDDNTTDDNTTVAPDNTTDENTTTAPSTPDNDTAGDNTTETTAASNDGPDNTAAENTTDGNTTDGNETGDAVTGMAAVTQQNATETFDFVTSNGEEDGPYLVDGEPVTDVAEVTFESEEAAPDEDEAPGESDEATDDTETATGDLVVEDLEAPAYAAPGSTVTVNATVTNEAAEDREEDVAFRLEGGDVDVVLHQTVAVEANETTTVTFDVNTTDVPMGAYIHGVTTENSSEFDEIAVTNESAVDVEDQNLTDGTLTVDSVFVPESGYVAIHDSSALDANASVDAESVVGVSDYLEAGYHEDVNVTLYEDVPGAEFDNATVNDTETLAAVPHLETNVTDETDAADNATFDFVTSDGEEDGPYLVDGELVVDSAAVTADAETNATA